MTQDMKVIEEEYVVVNQDLFPGVQFKPKFRFYWMSDVVLIKREKLKWWHRFAIFYIDKIRFTSEFKKSKTDNYYFGERVIATIVDDKIASVRKVDLVPDQEVFTEIVVDESVNDDLIDANVEIEATKVEVVDVARKDVLETK